MIRYFMTVVNDGRAALLDPRECIRIISDMFAAVQRIIHNSHEVPYHGPKGAFS